MAIDIGQFVQTFFEESLEGLDIMEAGLLALVEGEAELEKWGRIHRDIIVRFGRFPHRNAVLGRETTPEEQLFLDEAVSAADSIFCGRPPCDGDFRGHESLSGAPSVHDRPDDPR